MIKELTIKQQSNCIYVKKIKIKGLKFINLSKQSRK